MIMNANNMNWNCMSFELYDLSSKTKEHSVAIQGFQDNPALALAGYIAGLFFDVGILSSRWDIRGLLVECITIDMQKILKKSASNNELNDNLRKLLIVHGGLVKYINKLIEKQVNWGTFKYYRLKNKKIIEYV